MDRMEAAWYAVEAARKKLLKVVPEIDWKEWGPGPEGEIPKNGGYVKCAVWKLLLAIDEFNTTLR